MTTVNWKEKLKGNPIPWLLEEDETQPAIRYYALRDRRLIRVDIQGIPRFIAIFHLFSKIAKGRPATVEETAGCVFS
jgi:hypothetical protein